MTTITFPTMTAEVLSILTEAERTVAGPWPQMEVPGGHLQAVRVSALGRATILTHGGQPQGFVLMARGRSDVEGDFAVNVPNMATSSWEEVTMKIKEVRAPLFIVNTGRGWEVLAGGHDLVNPAVLRVFASTYHMEMHDGCTTESDCPGNVYRTENDKSVRSWQLFIESLLRGENPFLTI
ncbi:MAG: hypothetical protein JSR76_06855 [Verrucomicrobia bacterium]|nr:hypothetical protein [Verrucomicrobiota bacterium]